MKKGIRIIGGEYKGHKIHLVRGIRPTSNLVRKAIFDILGAVDGLRVVDLFAGTGALGLEALSRGAEFAYFIEKSEKVAKILQKNVWLLNYVDKSEVIIEDVFKSKIPECDVIFADPPYNRNYGKKLVEYLRGVEALLVLEHSKFEDVPYGRKYRFGDTIVRVIELDKII